MVNPIVADPAGVGPGAARVLSGMRVLELASMVAGPYCSKILGDLGADVIKIEPPEGDEARRVGPFAGGRPGPDRSLLFLHLNTSKRSCCIDMGRPEGIEEWARLAVQADAIVTDWSWAALEQAGVDMDRIVSQNPAVVVLSVTPFGSSGPYRDYRANPLTTFHGAGEGYLTPIASHLLPDVLDRPPLRQGRFAGEYKLATFASTVLLAAVYHARATGHGQTIDLSKQDALLGLNFLEFVPYLTSGRSPTRASIAVPFGGIMPCADGYLQISLHEEHQWAALMTMIGEPDWAQEDWATDPASRVAHADEINKHFVEWLRGHTRHEIVDAGQAMKVTVAPYRSLREVSESEQMSARGFFQPVVQDEIGECLHPTAPWRFDHAIVRPGPAPRLGQHPGLGFGAGARPAAPTRVPPRRGALAGLRVVDFTWAVAGPTASMILASLGAEVIKVESRLRLDVLRRSPDTSATVNRLKKGVTLNLRHPKAVELAKRLVAAGDVVTESFRPGVMDSLGLGYADLRAVNDDLVMLSSSMAGQHGPQSRFAGYASMFVALSGLGDMTGYEDGPPSQILVGGDVIVGIHGAFSVIAALLHRQRTGRGLHIDLSAIESQSCLIGDSLLDFAVNGSIQRRAGNDEPGLAPHNCYRCRGDDRWVAIAVTSDREWASFGEAIGSPPWASEGRFATGDSRFAHRRDLDELVTSWTSDRSAAEITNILQEAGVAAIPSYPASELFSDPQVLDHQMLVRAAAADGAEVPLVRLGGQLSVTPMSAERAGPGLGEHNDEVFQGLLGLSQEEIDALTAEGVFT